ncbi:restriction endonuclease subunit S [Vibrio sinaloensis]|uniref:restriction endonuclease subunit S n=1 Tax=Photobacterium sp. (strain ATCC 43367) TaxID=379097 RepID=UPI00068E2025|nr:restriction endonuclease subunit S [Vibrio sinaloensis]
MSWPLVKLGEIVQNCNAKRVPLKQADRLNRQGCYDYYGASGVIDHVDDYIFDGDYLLIGEDGNNLISRSSPIAFHARGKFWVNNHAHILAFNGKADLGFLAYYINSINLEPYVTGSAQPKLNKKNLDSILIPLPPLEEQKRIAAILDKADAIRQKRKQAIDLADEFLRCVFLDMFGDPVTNPKGWDVKSLSEIARIQIGPFGTQLHKQDYIENGIPLINPTHIVRGDIIPKNNLTISSEKHQELTEYHLKTGDIVMGRRGEMGRCAIVNEREDGWLCGTGSLFIRPSKTGVFSEYLNKLLSSEAIKKHLEGESQGATMPNLNKTIVGNIKVPVPSDEALNQFSSIKSQFLRYLDTLHSFSSEKYFESLSHQSFSDQL